MRVTTSSGCTVHFSRNASQTNQQANPYRVNIDKGHEQCLAQTVLGNQIIVAMLDNGAWTIRYLGSHIHVKNLCNYAYVTNNTHISDRCHSTALELITSPNRRPVYALNVSMILHKVSKRGSDLLCCTCSASALQKASTRREQAGAGTGNPTALMSFIRATACRPSPRAA